MGRGKKHFSLDSAVEAWRGGGEGGVVQWRGESRAAVTGRHPSIYTGPLSTCERPLQQEIIPKGEWKWPGFATQIEIVEYVA